MRVGLLHFRVGETDGVSLEMEKWRIVLERLGHEVYFVAGELNDVPGFKVPSLSMKDPENEFIHRNAFVELSTGREEFQRRFNAYVSRILEELLALPKFDVLIANNVCSLGFNLAAGVAITEYCRATQTALVTHNHDFHWERERYSRPTHDLVLNVLQKYFPPDLDGAVHLTINRIAQRELMKRRGLESYVVPNVFDFDQPRWTVDDYNVQLKRELCISDGDITFLHATRIVERKAVEIAVDFVRSFAEKIGNPEIVHLVFSGFPERESVGYYEKIHTLAAYMPFRTHFVHDRIKPLRTTANGRNYFSFWDAYAICDVVTYTSVLEGWGNQLIEAVFARKPLVVLEYPVYKTDIAPLGFKFISLGDEYTFNEESGLYEVSKERLEVAVDQLRILLSNAELLERTVERNFEIGRTHLSLHSLQSLVEEILSKVRPPTKNTHSRQR